MSDPQLTAASLCAKAGLSASIDTTIRNLAGRHAIMSGKYGDKPAIFRLALSDKAKSANSETWDELTRVGPFMQRGPNRIAQGLDNLGDGQLLISEVAVGNPYLPYLKKPDPLHSRRLAAWLYQYAAPTIESRDARTDFWLKQARKSSGKQPFPHLKQREDRILEIMQSLAASLKGRTWRVAITHGDYHPNNLVWDGTHLTGIDIGGSSSLPIYKDMARCLVHLARRDSALSDEALFGVDQSLIRAFSEKFELCEWERQTALPFFIGFECLIKVEQPNAPPWRLKAAGALYDGFVEDAKSL